MSAETQVSPRTEGSGPRWSARHPAKAVLAYAAAYLLLTVGGDLLFSARLPLLAMQVLAFLIVIGTLALSLLLALSICRLKLRPAAEAGWMLGMLALFLLARPEVLFVVGRWLGRPAAGAAMHDLLLISPRQQLLGNGALVAWAVFLGRLVSRVIREGKLLLPVALVASIADVITVFWGLVAHVAAEAPEVVEAFSAHAPAPASAVPLIPILTAVGIGDFLFLGLFLAVAHRYAMNAASAMWASLGVLLVAPFAFVIWPHLPGVPGLPFLSVAVLATNWRYLKFTADEKRALLFAGVLVIAVATWVIMRH